MWLDCYRNKTLRWFTGYPIEVNCKLDLRWLRLHDGAELELFDGLRGLYMPGAIDAFDGNVFVAAYRWGNNCTTTLTEPAYGRRGIAPRLIMASCRLDPGRRWSAVRHEWGQRAHVKAFALIQEELRVLPS